MCRSIAIGKWHPDAQQLRLVIFIYYYGLYYYRPLGMCSSGTASSSRTAMTASRTNCVALSSPRARRPCPWPWPRSDVCSLALSLASEGYPRILGSRTKRGQRISSTRGHGSRFRTPLSTSQVYASSFFPRAAKDWSNLPADPANSQSLEALNSLLGETFP